jgi:transposase-like protein
MLFVLLTAGGCGTAEIMRHTGVSKAAVWRWRVGFITDGAPGLLRDKTRPPRVPPLEAKIAARVVCATWTDPPGATTPPEVRARAVRMVLEHAGDHDSRWAAIGLIAAKIGRTGETLRKWVRQAERGQGIRPGLTSDERDRMKGSCPAAWCRSGTTEQLAACSGCQRRQTDGQIIAEWRDGFKRHVAGALHRPFVVLLEQQSAGQPSDRCFVRKDTDDIAAALDLSVEAFEWVGAV